MTGVSEGAPAPLFRAQDYRGEEISLGDLRDRIIVLYFYPRAMTPGCTREALRFNELYDEFASRNTVIIGISADPPERVKRFAEKHGLRFTLIPDPGEK